MVKLRQKWAALKSKWSGLYKDERGKLLALGAVVILCSTTAIYIAFADEKKDTELKVDTAPHMQTAEADGKGEKGRLVYQVNGDFSELKNPFSLAHESRAQMRTIKSAEKGEPEKIAIPNTKTEKADSAENVVKPQADKRVADLAMKSNENYVLKAIIDIAGQKSAIAEAGGRSVRLTEGSSLDDAKVVAIDAASISLRSADGTVRKYELR